MPSCVARAGSGPSPRPLASATCAPFVAPVSATRNRAGRPMSASPPRKSGRVQVRAPDIAATPAARKTSAATRTSGAASAGFTSTSGTVRNAARSTRSAQNAIGMATANGDGRSAGREAWSSPSHHSPPAMPVIERARSAMLLRSTVATSVAMPSIAALMPTLRFGPRRHPTSGARKEVANTAVAMMASVVLDWP